jgi:DNA polymerase-3 subunit alpha
MRKRGYHLLAIAYNQTGYSNLVRLSSWAWTKGFYYRARVNHEELMKYKEGIIFTSCCYASEIGQAFDGGGEEAGFSKIEEYISMFGKDNFYLEIMLLDFAKQKPYDVFIIKAAERYGLQLILTNDCHYCKAEDSKYQRLMLMVQTQKTIQDIESKMAEDGLQDFFELQDQNLWMKTEEELNDKWLKDYSDVIDYDIFKLAKRNTVEICRRAKGVELDRSIKLPQIPDANLKLKEFVMQGFKQRGLPMTRQYLDRIKEEYSLICHKEFASYFLIQKMMMDEARRVCRELLGWGDGSEATGPGRGSAVGSLVCYCLKITDVDPIKHDLLFSRFLSPARGGKSLNLRFKNIDPLPLEF